LERDYKGYNVDLKEALRSILSDDKEPIILKIYDNLTEKDALELERRLIKEIGKKTDGGFLLNKTNGGNGTSGYKYSPERL